MGFPVAQVESSDFLPTVNNKPENICIFFPFPLFQSKHNWNQSRSMQNTLLIVLSEKWHRQTVSKCVERSQRRLPKGYTTITYLNCFVELYKFDHLRVDGLNKDTSDDFTEML